jgi:uncharacterized lipoprotein YmbA
MAAILSRRFLLAGGALMAAGCTTPPARLYTLEARPALQPTRASGTVMVKRVELAKYLDRPQIVRRSGAYELSTSEYERWGEGMREMVTRVLVENLSTRLSGCQVYDGGGPLTLRPDATLEVDISRFDAGPDGAVILEAQWLVQREKPQKARLQAQRISVPADASKTQAMVAAMSDALGQLGDQMARSLAT